MATISKLIEDTEKLLSMAAGIDVQIHVEDRLSLILQQNFTMLFDEFFWDDYTSYDTFTLDGTTGKITGTVAGKIIRFVDIHSVYYEKENVPLPRVRISENPTLIRRRSFGPYNLEKPTHVFKVFPVDTSGDIHVWFRTLPIWNDLDPDADDIAMDATLLTVAAAYSFLVDDGTNQNAEAKLKAMYDKRFVQLRRLEAQHGVLKASQTDAGSYPMDWYQGP